jgi:hypothetical protein
VVAIRGILFLVLLGLMGLGGYQVYQLYLKRPGGAGRLGRGSPKPGMKRVSKTVVASFEIDSSPRGARIFLNGEDMKQSTPGVFEKFTSPRKVEISLQHPKFKIPWKRIVPVHEGDLVKLTADLANPPALEGSPLPGGKVSLPPAGATGYRPGRRPAQSRTPSVVPDDPGGSVAPDEALLHVTSEEPGAQVLINGAARGTTPLRRKVRPATFTVQVTRGDRRSDQRVVTLAPGEIKRLHFTLGR